jgi:hypothetical protein
MRLLLAVAALLFSSCASIHPDAYTPTSCYELKRDARKAGAYRVGAGAVAAGLSAGGTVATLVSDSNGAQVGLALGAVLAGAFGLAAGLTADEAQKDWVDHCPYIPVDTQIPEGTALAGE